MYPNPFRYHRATSLAEAASLLAQLGEDARVLAGGQSLIPLMKFRLAAPTDLIDLNFIPSLSYLRKEGGELRLGALTRHAAVAASETAAEIPILVDCASGIADVQIRNRGTVAGSVAEADPSGDWVPVLLALDSRVCCLGPGGDRSVALSAFIRDAYTTDLAPDEVIKEVIVKKPPPGSGGAYIAFKRSAQVYATASVAVQLVLEEEVCSQISLYLGCLGLTAIRAAEAEAELRGGRLTEEALSRAATAAMAAAQPQSDMRGSADYKRALVKALVKRALEVAGRRARGERVEMSHYYA
ncbi:MAG: FAD binding domain-containing protein [Acidobacteriota bacterium]